MEQGRLGSTKKRGQAEKLDQDNQGPHGRRGLGQSEARLGGHGQHICAKEAEEKP